MSNAPHDNRSIGARARTAAGWQLLSKGINMALQTATTIILARLLMPADFGIVAMATMVTGLALIFQDLGLGQALVQRRAIGKEHTASAFWGTLVMALLLYAALFLSAPLVADYFRESRMIPVLRISALSFLLSPFAVVPRSLLQRELDFRTPFFAGLASSLAYGAVGITMALLGYGYWALVFAGLAGGFMNTVALCILARYLPPLIPTFRGIGDLYGFGVGMTLWGIGGYIVDQIDYLVIGRRLDAGALGLYTRAFHLSRLPTTLAHGVLAAVMFPAFSKMAAEPLRFCRALKHSIAAVSLVTIPSTILIAVSGPELIPLLMGDQWTEAIVPLQILSGVVLHRALMSPGGAALKALGEVYWISALVAVHGLLVLAGAWIGTSWGINGAAIGVVVAYCVFFVLHATLLAIRVPMWTMRDLIEALYGPIIVGICVMVVASLVRHGCIVANTHDWVVLALTLGSGAAAGLLCTRHHIFPDGFNPFEEMRRYIEALRVR